MIWGILIFWDILIYDSYFMPEINSETHPRRPMAAGPSAAELHAAAAAAQRGHLRRQHQRLRQGQRLDAGAAALGGVDGWKAAVETGLYTVILCISWFFIVLFFGPTSSWFIYFVDSYPTCFFNWMLVFWSFCPWYVILFLGFGWSLLCPMWYLASPFHVVSFTETNEVRS